MDHGLSARRADRTPGLSRSARHYRPRVRDDGPLIAAVEAHLKENPDHGFGLLFDEALHPKGWGKTRAWRVYKALRLNLPRGGKRRLPERIRNPLEIPACANHTWHLPHNHCGWLRGVYKRLGDSRLIVEAELA